jgi:hypothetical protein
MVTHYQRMMRGKKMLAQLLLICLSLLISLSPALGQGYELGPPPTFPESMTGVQVPAMENTFEFPGLFSLGSLSVHPQTREASRTFFTTYYLAADQPIGWTGGAPCNEGTTLLTFQDAVLLRLNYFRAMAGVPAAVTFSALYSAKNQKAALMMSVNNQVNHFPDSSWSCYSAEGAEGASNSNLALEVNGRDAIDLYIQDPGTNNGFVGHRRWIFYPQTQTMGTGDIPANNGSAPANSLWVFDDNIWGPRPSTREEFVAWPPPGYVPYQVTCRRWSFSYPGADFSSATVTMTQDEVSLPVTPGPLATGYGENTLVWSPEGINFVERIINSKTWPVLIESWPVPAKDTVYRVTINNVIISGVPRSFAYSVTVFDPATPGPKNAPIAPIMLLLE